MGRYLMGYDVGSSSIKASIINIDSGELIATAASPERELEIIAQTQGWAEQDPDDWWRHLVAATLIMKNRQGIDLREVDAVGISYQMHGLIAVDKQNKPVRPAIIWCDSRAVEIGEKAFRALGERVCLTRLLNSPGNFTASKMRWVKENEPDVFARIDKVMLPGDYIAMRLTGVSATTPSGLSEGILWDYENDDLAGFLLDYYEIPHEFIPPVKPTFSVQGRITETVADELGFKPGVEVTYRAGDQPNNAFSLNVLNPGELAATAGTSGVVYGVGDTVCYDNLSRVNTFVHVNHSPESSRYGTLLCVNGTGILYSWLKHNTMANEVTYQEMNKLAQQAPLGANGLIILPFGNGSERTLKNRNIGALVHGLNFNIHNRTHLLRAAQEGIVYALKYGIEIMTGMGISLETVRAGHSNMFLSNLFSEIFANSLNTRVELFNTDGSQGAARGAGVGAGIYNFENAFSGLEIVNVVEPDPNLTEAYQDVYQTWKTILEGYLE